VQSSKSIIENSWKVLTVWLSDRAETRLCGKLEMREREREREIFGNQSSGRGVAFVEPRHLRPRGSLVSRISFATIISSTHAHLRVHFIPATSLSPRYPSAAARCDVVFDPRFSSELPNSAS